MSDNYADSGLCNKYGVAALKDRSAALSGQIADYKRLTVAQTQLDHFDAYLTISEYESERAAIGLTRSPWVY